VSRTAISEAAAALPVLTLARIAASDGDGSVILEVGAARVRATVDPSVHPVVIATALAKKERVLAQEEGGSWVVVGALRTSPTPGVDAADEYVIRAGRVRVEAAHEFSVVSGLSSLAVRAYGHVETLADQITSRASSVHKVIGRMLHLN
jgi:hypothetical protein